MSSNDNNNVFTGTVAVSHSHFGQGNGSIYIDDVQCSGTEIALVQCTYTTLHDCSHIEDAGVRCIEQCLVSAPSIPVVVGVIVTPTSATITFRVGRIANTRESYFISYRGVVIDRAHKRNSTVIGRGDINQTYAITLAGLQKIAKYNYVVTAVNCNGTTSTAEMTFKTLSDGEYSYCPVVIIVVSLFAVNQRHRQCCNLSRNHKSLPAQL